MEKKIVKKTKTQMVVGKQNYINQDSGEIIETIVIQKNIDSDFNFHKIWLMDILHVLDNFGSKKLKILVFLLKNMRNEDNSISVTYRYISEQTKISLPTVNLTMKELIECNVISNLRTGLYMFNPDLIIKGKPGKRQRLLIEYTKELDTLELEEEVLEIELKEIITENKKSLF